ncbi:MAG: hypothetical protein KBF42_10200 [Chitinophagales bacterium]|jgi:hypothetical protein|nr:hypothetical protein [Bacteroidota bacterium]MBK7569068.1 hypothetical protein [Bacteroidota bacterium]MBP8916862.1 hypothetical protein [Chitinophagales bacterium]MBP9221748.1 hypothetical protein [Chitinophagales bacterium]MBP9796329.1 hypothetical protein [Chitinophagales bacterium]
MSTNVEDVRVQEFAQQCLNALRRIKHSMPKTWKETLAPFQKEIKEVGAAHNVNDSAALELIISKLEKETALRENLRTSLTFYMAAYCVLAKVA